MVLLDKNKHKLVVICYSKDMEVMLKYNKTKYEIYPTNTISFVYKKDYLLSLKGDKPDIAKSVASIEWDLLNAKSTQALSRLEIYEDDVDFELLAGICISAVLIWHNMVITQRKSMSIAMMSMSVIRR